MFTWLFGDRGIPASYRHMNGYGSHTFQWVNAAGEQFFVKYHFKTDQGIKCLTSDDAARLAGSDPESHTGDLMQAIDSGNAPSWTLRVQVMPAAEAAGYHLNPFDLTKVWPHSDYPLIGIGKLVLDRNPDNYFAEVEQAAFDPAHFVPGIGPSPDKMLQGRLFAYGDAHRYRLGINHAQLPINRPHATNKDTYGRDGAMRFDAGYGREKNYEPNSFGGPEESGSALYGSLEGGPSGTYDWQDHDGDDFSQAGSLYRLLPEDAKGRLVENIASGLAQVSREDIVDRSIANFAQADPDYGSRIEVAVKARRA
jgi:catalase